MQIAMLGHKRVPSHEGGITFHKGNVDDLEAKLRYAITHPNTIRMFRYLASDYICDRFQWDKVVEATLKVYRGEA